ncbi:hypothetical protein WR25_05371 [Diploscapter pachys]|uniref:MARVEL domain-containing protein n=1 Tax=Diploscapter pachys TaxID=2018661 RepID=A0A2A2K9Z8_9BILA|nr:hypothetical protein WR25_05371 [Diploscapter pachys]
MSSSPDFLAGPLWSFFPILACVSFSEFCFGLVHVFFCLPLYFLILPILNGFLGLVAAVHAMFLRYPNKCDFYMQVSSALLSFVFFVLSAMETFCLQMQDTSGAITWRYKCHGYIARSVNIVGAATSTLLLALTSFGIFCWFKRYKLLQLVKNADLQGY